LGSLRTKGRKKLPGVIFEELEERGLLIRQAPTAAMAAPGGHMEPEAQDYSFSPKLGVVLAARSRPAVAVTCELQQLPTRHPRLFALGDEQEPVRALVREAPVAPPPGDFPHLPKAGPLAWFYQYDLVSISATRRRAVQQGRTDQHHVRLAQPAAVDRWLRPRSSGRTG
jgi:hypothetical protein